MSRNTLGPAIIRMAHPLAFTAFLRKIGAPYGAYLQRQGLPVLCEDPNSFVQLKKCWALFDDVARREDRMAGWRVGRFAGDNKLSAGLLNKLDSAPTLIMALRKLVQLVSTEASHLQIGILERQNCCIFYTRYPGMSNEPGYSVSQAYQLEVYIDLVRHFTGSGWQPKQIGIENSLYPAFLEERFPKSEIYINQEFGYLVIGRSCLQKKILTQHVKGNATFRLVDGRKLDSVEKLGMLMEPYLKEGYPGMDFAADLMETSVRTLARRLVDCGSSYQAVIDNARFSRARRLLLEGNRSINDIARSTGFKHQANFSRMFRRISGLTPLQFRRIESNTLH